MEYIDKIIYINLDHRTDRKEEIENELRSYSMDFKAERFEAISTPGFGILGCGKSHLEVLKLAKKRNYKNVLILEDDFCFLRSKSEIDTVINRIFEDKIEFDVIMLSYGEQEYTSTENVDLIKINKASTASGYLVNSNFYDKLIDLYECAMPLLNSTHEHWNYANDVVWFDLQKKSKWYGISPRCGKQRASYSDNSEIYQDYGK